MSGWDSPALDPSRLIIPFNSWPWPLPLISSLAAEGPAACGRPRAASEKPMALTPTTFVTNLVN